MIISHLFYLDLIIAIDRLLPGTMETNPWKTITLVLLMWFPMISPILGMILGGIAGIVFALRMIKK